MTSEDSAGGGSSEAAPRRFDSYRGPPPELAGRRAALVVVDLQYGSTHPDCGWVRFHRERGEGERMERYVERLDRLVFPNVQRLLEAFRQSARPIVYLTIAAEMPDYSDLRPAYRRNVERWRAEGAANPVLRGRLAQAQVRDEIAPRAGGRCFER